MPLGLITSNLVVLILAAVMPTEQFMAWGWRIGFGVGAALVTVVAITTSRSAPWASDSLSATSTASWMSADATTYACGSAASTGRPIGERPPVMSMNFDGRTRTALPASNPSRKYEVRFPSRLAVPNPKAVVRVLGLIP